MGMRLWRNMLRERACHDEIALCIRSQLKNVLTAFLEAEASIERDGVDVALPHAEPNRLLPRLTRCFDACVHQGRTGAGALPALEDVYSSELDGRFAEYARRGRSLDELCVAGGIAIYLGDELDNAWIGEVLRLNVDAEIRGDVRLDVGSGVRRRERVGKCDRADLGEERCVRRPRAAYRR